MLTEQLEEVLLIQSHSRSGSERYPPVGSGGKLHVSKRFHNEGSLGLLRTLRIRLVLAAAFPLVSVLGEERLKKLCLLPRVPNPGKSCFAKHGRQDTRFSRKRHHDGSCQADRYRQQFHMILGAIRSCNSATSIVPSS